MRLEEVKPQQQLNGVVPDGSVTVLGVNPMGADSIQVFAQTSGGTLIQRLLYRDDEPGIAQVENTRWTFNADPADFKLASEAYRISLAAQFDPYLAVRTSAVEPLPHQISAVYQHMLPQMPLRFLLADDPGAGKTVMTGLLIKELMERGSLRRCLIVAPGALCEQWQDELFAKFQLTFEILTNDAFEASATRNAFQDKNLCIARLDKLARDEAIQAKLKNSEWDLVVCDEAHKMSASIYGNEAKHTKRYQLGQLLGTLTQNLLLLTATPHNGKPEDFQLFMSLLDPDRFEGAKHHKDDKPDTSDLMRRLVKESLLRFDGTPLFPERRAYTVNYTLSPGERALYDNVTEYVTGEFNRADSLDGKRRNSVGFALTMLQRRLASSPEAIYQSIRRRRARLEDRLDQARREGRAALNDPVLYYAPADFLDEDDLPYDEREDADGQLLDNATAAATVVELEAEIDTLRHLEHQANNVRRSGDDRKWTELSHLLQENKEMFGEEGREKLIIFTEHKDTLNYLRGKIVSLLGDERAVVTIRGGMGRDYRREVESRFTQDANVRILIATDAAGEGINLQRAHLMICYDLPWNPNRLEQRFGRIHRIGQTEICHLWNLVSPETREGQVFQRLLSKLEAERNDLGGRVFDVLGSLTFDNKPLQELLREAVRYGDDPSVRARLNRAVDSSLDTEELKRLLAERSLTQDTLVASDVREIREEMERADAQKLEPHFIASFFLTAMKALGAIVLEREPGRYQIVRVPAVVLDCARGMYNTNAVLEAYERICFERALTAMEHAPLAELVYPGHPLLDALVEAVLRERGTALTQGAVLIDEGGWDTDIRRLYFIESKLVGGMGADRSTAHVLARDLRFIELDERGKARNAGFAPYLDYRVPTEEELKALTGHLGVDRSGQFENDALAYAAQEIIPELLEVTRRRRVGHIEKVQAAVRRRLTAECRYWDGCALELSQAEKDGKPNKRLSSQNAERNANEIQARMERRLGELEREKNIAAEPPRVTSGALVVPRGLLANLMGASSDPSVLDERSAIEAAAMAAVMAAERMQGNAPQDVSASKCGYDVLSRLASASPAADGPCQRFIEVKGVGEDATGVTVTRNEQLCALNNPETFVLAICRVARGPGGLMRSQWLAYLTNPFDHAPQGESISTTFDIKQLIAHARVLYREGKVA